MSVFTHCACSHRSAVYRVMQEHTSNAPPATAAAGTAAASAAATAAADTVASSDASKGFTVAEEVYPFYNWQEDYTDVNEHEVFAAVMGYLKRLKPADMQPARWQFRRSVIAHQLKLLLYALAASAESYNKLTTVAGVAAKMSKYPRLQYLADMLINKRWHTEQQQAEEEDVEGAVAGDSSSGSAAVAASSSDSSTTWQSDSDRPLRAAVYVEVAIFIAEQL
eukprot:21035-Heterococcus_DN1.PRE.2